MNKVKNILNSVQNTENSTGNAQYQILKSPQPGKQKRFGPWMNKALNWSKLKNDPRLSAAQKKTIDKILVSLKVPVRDTRKNRPPINFDPTGISVVELNRRLRRAIANRAASIGRTSNNSSNGRAKPITKTAPFANPVPTIPYGAGF